VSGNDHTPSNDYPDAHHGAKGEPGGLPHFSDQELTTMAETHAREDDAMRGHEGSSWFRRWFGRRGAR
jgi:hypothetical protein